MDLTRRQVTRLTQGSIEISELQENAKEKVKDKSDSVKTGDMKYAPKKKSDGGEKNFASLLGIPGIKMTKKAQEKFVKNKMRKD